MTFPEDMPENEKLALQVIGLDACSQSQAANAVEHPELHRDWQKGMDRLGLPRRSDEELAPLVAEWTARRAAQKGHR